MSDTHQQITPAGEDFLTIIIPVYNEGAAIEQTVNRLKEAISPYGWKIIAVNDGSKDDSLAILEKIPGISVVNHKVNRGYGASLKTGILTATTPYVCFYDADGQHQPQDLINLATNVDDYDMVVGDRGKQFYSTTMRAPGKWVLRQVSNILAGTRIPDLNSGLRVVKRDKIATVMHLCPNGFSFSTTSTLAFFHTGQLVKYYPITVKKRVGKSSVKIFKHGMQTIMLIVRLVSLFNPLKIFIPTSMVFISLGLIYQVYIFIFYGLHIEGGALLTLMTGIIIFFVGILADQVSALRLEGKQMFRD